MGSSSIPGNIVIMDNLPAHKVSGVRQAIEKVGASLLLLPPYSPDFNPIEMVFAKLKALLRKAAARTIPSPAASANSRPPNAETTSKPQGMTPSKSNPL